MVFNSLQFLWFFLIVYGVYRILPAVLPAHRAHRSQNWLLLIASYYFYAAWDYRFVTLLAASTIVDYTCGRVLGRMTDRRRRRAVMWVSIGFNLAMLGFFKYFNFFAANLQALFGALGWQVDFVTLRVLLPIGISFYTFVTMSYVIDVYRRHIHTTRDFVDFAVFVSYFPHLVAGPILRATALLPQIARPRRISGDQIRDGLWLIAWGFFQKIVVADNLAPLASHVFAPEAHPTGINVLLGTYAFAFQIYGDFAGYSNIARGTSKLMGIELIENFRFPYLVVTPQAFWRNWHISLSTWLRDYLYIPLGGSRGTPAQTRRNLLITMILGGVDLRFVGTLSGRSARPLSSVRARVRGDDARTPPAGMAAHVSPHVLRMVDFQSPLGRQDRRADAQPPDAFLTVHDGRDGLGDPATAVHRSAPHRAPVRGRAG